MTSFKIGETLKCYDRRNTFWVSVTGVTEDGMLLVNDYPKSNGTTYMVHPKQCRRPKKVKSVRITKEQLAKALDNAGYNVHTEVFSGIAAELGL